jgi:hypothetical protein
MNRKKELVQQYKVIKTEAGVFQIKNTINHKVLVSSTMNLRSLNGKRIELQMGGHRNRALQQEWKEYGEDAFVFEVLEVLEKQDNPFFDAKDALKKLEEKWMEQLQPFGDRGYHKIN